VKHELVVVRFQNQQVTLRQGVLDVRGRASKIGSNAYLQSRTLVHESDTDWIGRVVDREEGLDSDVTDDEVPVRPIFYDLLLPSEELITRSSRGAGHVDRGSVPSSINARAVRVVTMLVSDHDSVDRLWAHADQTQALGDLLGAEPGVDEYSGIPSPGEDRVAPAPASQHCDFHFVEVLIVTRPDVSLSLAMPRARSR
jgi:hypothetical protein